MPGKHLSVERGGHDLQHQKLIGISPRIVDTEKSGYLSSDYEGSSHQGLYALRLQYLIGTGIRGIILTERRNEEFSFVFKRFKPALKTFDRDVLKIVLLRIHTFTAPLICVVPARSYAVQLKQVCPVGIVMPADVLQHEINAFLILGPVQKIAQIVSYRTFLLTV